MQNIEDRLQALVDKSLNHKFVYNMVLGLLHPRTGFYWTGAGGIAEPSSNRPMTADTPFLIASVTKMYTAAAVMILKEQSRIRLDDQIARHLPHVDLKGLHRFRGKEYTDSLTVRHLLGQTSGLPDYFLERPLQGKTIFEQVAAGHDRAWELEDVIALTKENFKAKFAPASFEAPGGAHYSDTNYKLLGAIIEAVTQKPLHDVFAQFFFKPLDLSQTYLFGQPRADLAGEPARVFHKRDPLVADKLMKSHGPEGGVVSTIKDTLQFGEAFFAGRLFSQSETLAEMQQWNKMFFPLQYGYGLMRFKMPRFLSPFGYNPDLIGHSGSSASFLYYCKELDLLMAGSLNQMTLQRAPFQLMIRIAQLFAK